jgi:chromate transporter
MDKLIGLIVSFGKIGLFSLGGGNSMLFMIEAECVTRNKWITAEEFSSMTGMSFLFPGLTAFKIAGVIGYQVAGVAGLLAAIIALNMPGLLMMMACYAALVSYKSNPWVAKSIDGMRYAATAMLAAMLVSFAMSTVKAAYSWQAIALSLVFFGALTYFNVNVFVGLLAFIGLYVAVA